MEFNTLKQGLNSCLLCHDALCTKACKNGVDPARIIRALRFENNLGAALRVSECCIDCNAPCIDNCVIKGSVEIKNIITDLLKNKSNENYNNSSLKTDICGIELENPFLLSSSVVSSNYEMIKRAFEMGWAGCSLKTISMIDMEEASPRYNAIKGNNTFTAFKNIEQLSEKSVDENMEIITKLKHEFPNKFILASIMGRNDNEWAYIAKRCMDAGADALELNFSCPNMTAEETGSDIGQVPALVERYTKAVTSSVSIPVIAKLTPNVKTMSEAAEAALRGGALGIAAINTIKSITEDRILENITNKDDPKYISVGGLSGASVKPIALRFISELSHNEKLDNMHISAMGGIYNYKDALMFLSLGAKSLQITTAVMEYGYRIIDDLLEGLSLYLSKNNLQMKDLYKINNKYVVETKNLKRDFIIYPKINRSTCVSCGRCYISCRDGGHQALEFIDRKPKLNPNKCVGCHLCVLVCPTSSITPSDKKVSK